MLAHVDLIFTGTMQMQAEQTSLAELIEVTGRCRINDLDNGQRP